MDNLQCVNGTIMNMKGASIIGADVDAWVTIIDQAIDWHRQHPDNFMGKQQHQATYNEVIDGLRSMCDDLAANKAQIEQLRDDA